MSEHVCTWHVAGLALVTEGLYTGYNELQQCTAPECAQMRAIRLARTMPDNPYAAGKLSNQNNCPCQPCCQARQTWMR